MRWGDGIILMMMQMDMRGSRRGWGWRWFCSVCRWEGGDRWNVCRVGRGEGGPTTLFFSLFLVGVVFYIRKYLERNTIMQTVILHITEALSLISVEIQLLSRIQRIQPSENQFREFWNFGKTFGKIFGKTFPANRSCFQMHSFSNTVSCNLEWLRSRCLAGLKCHGII